MEGTAASVQKVGSKVVIGKPQDSLTVEAFDRPRNGQSPKFEEG